MTPEPWTWALLTLAAFRAWKLIADDRILDRPRDWFIEKLNIRRGSPSGVYWRDFLICPWCAGFWLSALAYTGWVLLLGDPSWDDAYMAPVTVFAISAGVGMLGTIYEAISGE